MIVRPTALALALFVLAAAGLAAASAGDDEAPPPSSGGHAQLASASAASAIALPRDADPRLSVGRVVPPRPAGRAPRSVEVLRARDPQGGEALAVTLKRVRRHRGPAAWRDVFCLDSVRVGALARRRFSASACRPVRGTEVAQGPLLYSSSSTPNQATRISGFAPPGARRMTAAGIGPTVEVPLGREGSWFLAVAHDVRHAHAHRRARRRHHPLPAIEDPHELGAGGRAGSGRPDRRLHLGGERWGAHPRASPRPHVPAVRPARPSRTRERVRPADVR